MKPYVDPSIPLKPQSLKEQIREIRAHLGCLEEHLADAKRRHRKLNTGNGSYDEVEYHCHQIALHNAFIRCKLDLRKDKSGYDGQGAQFGRLADGSLYKCYANWRDE